MEEEFKREPVWVVPPFNVDVGFEPGDGTVLMEMAGGGIDVQSILRAYDQGFFPWFSFRDTEFPRWVFPLRRFVLFPDDVHVSHSMRNLINRGELRVTFNKAFRAVAEGCRKPRYEENGAWLSRHLVDVCCEVNRMGRAMSVEVWNRDGELVGGLYGILSGPVFCGESMFSLVPSASKLAMIRLAQLMSPLPGMLIDCQMRTAHLESMGAIYIEASDYISMLRNPSYSRYSTAAIYNTLMQKTLGPDDFTPLQQ